VQLIVLRENSTISFGETYKSQRHTMYSAWRSIPKYRAHIQRSNVYEKKNQCRTKCTI